MTFNTFNTLKLALVSLLSIGLTAFGQPFDFEAPDVKPGSALSSRAADTAAWITSINKAEVKTRDLQARTKNFLSPDIQPTFSVLLGLYDETYTVTWTSNMWLRNKDGWARVLAERSIQTKDLTNVHLSLDAFKTTKTAYDHVSGIVKMHLTGSLRFADLVLDLQVPVWGSQDYTSIINDHDVTGSTANLGGKDMTVIYWEVHIPRK